MHLHNCMCFSAHLKKLLHYLSTLFWAPGGPGSVWNYSGALVRSTSMSGRFACGCWTILQFFDVVQTTSNLVGSSPRCIWIPPHWISQLWDLTILGLWLDNYHTLPNNPIDYNSSCWWIVLYCIKEWEIQTLPMRNHNAQHLLTFLTYLLSSLIWLWLFLQSLSLPLSLLVRPLTPWQVVLLWYITGCIVIMLSLLTLQIYP